MVSAHRAGWFRGSYICCLRQRPMSESEHNPSTQPAAAGGHNLQPRRGWPPSPLNPLNLLNPLNPHAAGVSKSAPQASDISPKEEYNNSIS